MEELAVKVITNNEMSAICLESSDKYLGIFLHMVERYVSKGEYVENKRLLLQKSPDKRPYITTAYYICYFSCLSLCASKNQPLGTLEFDNFPTLKKSEIRMQRQQLPFRQIETII